LKGAQNNLAQGVALGCFITPFQGGNVQSAAQEVCFGDVWQLAAALNRVELPPGSACCRRISTTADRLSSIAAAATSDLLRQLTGAM